MGRRRELKDLRVLITGASQGIGRALAAEAARRGMSVLAAARSPEKLDELAAEVRAAGGTIETIPADVTDPDGRRAMADAARERFGGLDVLINNAGIGATGHMMDTEADTIRKIFEVNVFGLIETTRVALPLLRETGRTPAIVNISSVVARRALPARSHYSASKFAVQGFSEALRGEIEKDGIDVVVVNPGLTQTNFSDNMLERKAKVQLDHLRGMTPDEVASRTLDALARGKHEVTFTLRGRMLVFVGRFLPFVVDHFARKRVRKLFKEEIDQRRRDRLRTGEQSARV